jgi:hypothetical protein
VKERRREWEVEYNNFKPEHLAAVQMDKELFTWSVRVQYLTERMRLIHIVKAEVSMGMHDRLDSGVPFLPPRWRSGECYTSPVARD